MLNHLLVTAIFSYVHLIKPTVTKVEEMVWAYKTQMLHFFFKLFIFQKKRKKMKTTAVPQIQVVFTGAHKD